MVGTKQDKSKNENETENLHQHKARQSKSRVAVNKKTMSISKNTVLQTMHKKLGSDFQELVTENVIMWPAGLWLHSKLGKTVMKMGTLAMAQWLSW